jgi:hypothetical protein
MRTFLNKVTDMVGGGWLLEQNELENNGRS